ncbi:GDSL esterase/lipase At1g28600-like [Lolium rigidum]|uniref:GDSL esterase/lipase At1g28600-like n=1 Tax=Lolium rigidum TaxID=89674 RepID=UPI001F5C610C|nr:GDSL esterase/lipase At1g28600-like [Lolium rigidum]
MAPFSRLLLALAAVLLVAVTGEADAGGSLAWFDRVFSFGDSLTDTGNSAILPATAGGPFTNAPYGQTHFKRPGAGGRASNVVVDSIVELLKLPYLASRSVDDFRRRSLTDTRNAAIVPATARSGQTRLKSTSNRASDGRLVIDFIVESLELPQPTPYLAGKTANDFLQGVNFAVGGATALDMAFLKSKGITSFVPISLSNQTTWFNGVLKLLNSTRNEQRKMMASSLFYIGEIGFNDYSFALMNNDTVGLAESLVPDIIGVIRSALIDVIDAGARRIVVTGMIPMGCEPELLALLPSGASGYYDPESGCIARFNRLAQLHNRALNRMLSKLRRAYRRTSIYYGDLYTPVTAIVSSPGEYGFGSEPLAACCGGGGGPYNFNFAFFCGTPLSTTCADPSKSVSWDGIHYTEAANKFVADTMFNGL